MKYLDRVRNILAPYFTKYEISIPCDVINIKGNFTSFDSDDLYIEIKDEAKYKDINILEYNKCISFAVSPTYIDNGIYRFEINKAPLESIDIKLLLLHGYIYIFHKDGFIINEITITLKEDDIITLRDNNDIIASDFGNELTLNLKKTNYPELACKFLGNYIVLNPNEDTWQYFKKKNIPNIHKFMLNFIPYKIYVYDSSDGFIKEDNMIRNFPLYIKNTSSAKMIIFYNGISIDKWDKNSDTNRKYLFQKELSFLLNNDNIYNYLYNNIDTKFIPNHLVDMNINYQDDLDLELRNNKLNFDLSYMCNEQRRRMNYFIDENEITRATKLDTLISTRMTITDLYSDKNNWISINIYNNKGYHPEVYYKGVKYNDRIFVESMGPNMTININELRFLQYYDIDYSKDILEHIYIVLRAPDLIDVHYMNIFHTYNGTLPVGRAFFDLRGKRITNNGYLVRENELGFNVIPPNNLLCIFPRRNYKVHNIQASGYIRDIYTKKYHLKYKNFTTSELNDINGNDIIYNRYIKSSYLYLDYIDDSMQIYCGPYILMQGYDYDIISPTLIKFKKPLYKYKEDDINSDYVDITIMYDLSDKLPKYDLSSSWCKKIFEDKVIKDELFSESELQVLNIKDGFDCPILYREDVYKHNIFNTKYLSSELVLDGTNNVYGDKWIEDVEFEFGKVVKEVNGYKYIDYNGYLDDTSYTYKNSDFPRSITLPEEFPINALIAEDIMAKRKLIREGLNYPENRPRNEMYRKTFGKSPYSYGINKIFCRADIRYLGTIPFDAIYKDDTL